MADPNIIEQEVLVALTTAGFSDAEGALESIRKKLGHTIKDIEKFKKAFGNDIPKGARQVVKGFEKMEEASSGAFKTTEKGSKKAASGMKKFLRTVNKASSAMIGVGAAILKLTHVAIGLQQGFLKTSAGVNRLGIGMGQLESSLERVADQTALTLKSTTALFDAYQMDMRFVSLEGFEEMMKRIQKVVGPNEQAMQQMGGVLTSLSGKFPVLAKQMQTVTDENRAFLLEQVRRLQLAGEISTIEGRTLQAYLRGNSQMSAADKKLYDENQKQQKAMMEVARAFEKLAVTAGQMVLPTIVKITKAIEYMQDNFSGVYKTVEGIVAALLVMKAATTAIKFGSMASAASVAAGGAGVTAMGALPGTAAVGGAMGIGATGSVVGTLAISASVAALIAGAVYSGMTWLSKDFAEAQGKSEKTQGIIDWLPQWMTPGVGGKIGKEQDYSALEKKKEALRAAGEVWTPKKKYRKGVEGRAEAAKDQQKWKDEVRDKMRAKEGYKSGAVKRRENDALEKNAEIQQDIIDAQIAQKQYAEALAGLYQKQASYLSTSLKYMSMTGNLSQKEIRARTKDTVDTAIKEQEALKEVLAAMEGQTPEGKAMLLDSGLTSEAYKKAMAEAKKAGTEGEQTRLAQVATDKEILTLRDGILKKELDINDAYMSATSAHEQRLKAMGLESARASKLIEIADNYAIGVGASAKMRLDLYDAEGQKIKELRLQLKSNADAMATAAENGRSTLTLANQRKEIENEILDSTLKQNQAVKAMRDGWVSAISAMQTGAGGFTEIIMNAETNTALISRLPGQIASAYSGYTNRRGERKGFLQSERFTGTMGGIGGRQSDRGDYMENMGIQWLARGSAQRAIEDMEAKGRRATGAGGTAFGMAGSKHYYGVANTGGDIGSRRPREYGGGGSGGSMGSRSSAPYVVKPSSAADVGGTNVTAPITLNITVENVDYIPAAVTKHVEIAVEKAFEKGT